MIDTDPYSIIDIVSAEWLTKLKTLFCSSSDIWNIPYKDNPDRRINQIDKIPLVQEFVDEFICPIVPHEDITLKGNIFKVYSPYDVHTDVNVDVVGYVPYKSFVVPIYLEGSNVEYPKFFCYNQRRYTKATRLRKGAPVDEDIIYNEPIFDDYVGHGIKNLEKEDKISYDWWKEHIDAEEVPYSTFEKLSLNAEFQWRPGNIIVFDSWQFHSPSNFRLLGYRYKIGVGIAVLRAI